MSLVEPSYEVTNQPMPAPPVEPQPQENPAEEYISTDPADPYFNSLMTTAFHSASTQYDFSSAFVGSNDFVNKVSQMAYYGESEKYNELISCKGPFQYSDKTSLVNKAFRYGWTSLMYTCWNGNRDFFNNLFVNYIIDVNKKSQEGFTALHLACIRKNLELIIPLIRYGADINIKDDYDYFPLDYLKQYPIDTNEIRKEYLIYQNWKRRKFFAIVYNNLIKSNYRHNIFEIEDLTRTIVSFL